MQWTSDCTKALASTKERGDKKALKSLKKKQVRLLSFRVVLSRVLDFVCRRLPRLDFRRSLGSGRVPTLEPSQLYTQLKQL